MKSESYKVINRNIAYWIISFLFGTTCIIGYIVDGNQTITAMLGSALIESILFYIVIRVLDWISYHRIFSEEVNTHNERRGILDFFEKNTWIKLLIILLLVWIPWLVIRYPGVKAGGVDFQIQQFMGLDTRARHLSSVIYENHYINAHHPVLLTVLFGAFVKLGVVLGNPNGGLFCCSILVCILNAIGWSYVLTIIKDYISVKVWKILLGLFLLNPLIMSLNSAILKDNLFATCLAVYSVCILQFIKSEDKSRCVNKLIIFSILLPFIKNQGIYIVVITGVILLLCYRMYFKKLLPCIVLPIIVFNIVFQGIVMPALKIAPGGKQEVLSVLFQTVAGAINDNPDILESDEYLEIKKVLDVDDWAIYKPYKADAIKFCFNQQSTTDELVGFVEAWLKIGLRYPCSYMKAFVLQTDGYYCIDSINDWSIRGNEIIVSNEGHTISAEYFDTVCFKLNSFLDFVTSGDRTKYLFSIPMAFWGILISIVIWRGEIKGLVWLSPVLLQWLTCLLSPVNASGRYGMYIYEMSLFVIFYVVGAKDNLLFHKQENRV